MGDCYKGDYEKAIPPAERSLLIFKRVDDHKSIGDCYNQIGTIYFYKSELRKALTAFQKSKTFFEKVDFKKDIVSSTNNIGAIYYALVNFPKAIEYYKLAVKIDE